VRAVVAERARARFFSPFRRLPRPRLLRLVDVDHNRRDALATLDLVRKLAPAASVRFAGGDYDARVPLTR
jgi:hypothetical protein